MNRALHILLILGILGGVALGFHRTRGAEPSSSVSLSPPSAVPTAPPVEARKPRRPERRARAEVPRIDAAEAEAWLKRNRGRQVLVGGRWRAR